MAVATRAQSRVELKAIPGPWLPDQNVRQLAGEDDDEKKVSTMKIIERAFYHWSNVVVVNMPGDDRTGDAHHIARR